MSQNRFCVEVKHDTQHKQWQRLSVTTLSDQALDGDAYCAQYAIDNQMNPHQLAWRIIEIDHNYVGRKTGGLVRVVRMKASAAEENRGTAPRFGYYINLDERGDFQADVRDESGKIVFEFCAGNSLGDDESSLFEDGFMSDKTDVQGLAQYLRDMGVIPANGSLLQMRDFEAATM